MVQGHSLRGIRKVNDTKGKKVRCKGPKEMEICSAAGRIVTVEGEPLGRIEMDEISAVEPCADPIIVGGVTSQVKFAMKRVSKEGKNKGFV